MPEFDMPDSTGVMEKKFDRSVSNIIPGGSPNASIVGSVNQASGTTIPYNQMPTAQKLEYDKAMRGIYWQ